MKVFKYLSSLLLVWILFYPNGQATITNDPGLNNSIDSISPIIEEPLYKIIEFMPIFKGCEESIDKNLRKKCSDDQIFSFIQEHLIYPQKAIKNKTEGIAVIKFIVKNDGSLNFDTNINNNILKNPGDGCGEEALRILKTMPNWIAGKIKDQNVNVQVVIPVHFQLNNIKSSTSTLHKASIKWNNELLEGHYYHSDHSKYVTGNCSLALAKKIMSKTSAGIPIFFKPEEQQNNGFTKYFISVGKNGKKWLINSDTKNKSLKKKVLKALNEGTIIYFYNWDYKKTFLELHISG